MQRIQVRAWDVAIAVAALAGYFSLSRIWHIGWSDFFWDFGVYQRAVADVVLGENPYRANAPLPFFYHPFVLYVFMWLDRWVGLDNALIGLCGSAALVFLWGCRRFWLGLPRSQHPDSPQQGFWLPALMLVAAFSFAQAGMQSLISGNLTLYLHLGLIGAALVYIDGRKPGQWLTVLALLFTALLVKPYFMVYVLPLWLIQRFSLRSMMSLSITVAAALAIYLLFWIFDRSHSQAFVEALARQLRSGTDLGISFFGLAETFVPAGRAIKIHMVFAVAIAGIVLFLRRLGTGVTAAAASDGAIFLLAYALVTLCNPRMKEYDLIPGIICLYFYFSLCGNFGRVLVLLSLIVAQLPLWVVLLRGMDNTPVVFTLIGYWQTGAVLLVLLHFSVATYGLFRNRSQPKLERAQNKYEEGKSLQDG